MLSAASDSETKTIVYELSNDSFSKAVFRVRVELPLTRFGSASPGARAAALPVLAAARAVPGARHRVGAAGAEPRRGGRRHAGRREARLLLQGAAALLPLVPPDLARGVPRGRVPRVSPQWSAAPGGGGAWSCSA